MREKIFVGFINILLVSGMISAVANSTTGQTSTGQTGTLDSNQTFTIPTIGLAATTFNSVVHDAGIGQSFTVSATWFSIASMQFQMNGTGWTGTLTGQIYAVSGVLGTNALPTGPALATSAPVSVSAFPVGQAPAAITFSFNGVVLAGASYFAVVNATGVPGSNEPNLPKAFYNPNANYGNHNPARMHTDDFLWFDFSNTAAFWFIVTGSRVPNPNLTGTPGLSPLLFLPAIIFIIAVTFELLRLKPGVL